MCRARGAGWSRPQTGSGYAVRIPERGAGWGIGALAVQLVSVTNLDGIPRELAGLQEGLRPEPGSSTPAGRGTGGAEKSARLLRRQPGLHPEAVRTEDYSFGPQGHHSGFDESGSFEGVVGDKSLIREKGVEIVRTDNSTEFCC